MKGLKTHEIDQVRAAQIWLEMGKRTQAREATGPVLVDILIYRPFRGVHRSLVPHGLWPFQTEIAAKLTSRG
jgi:hypothetical protein